MKWFNNLKIGVKLIFSFILIAIIAGIVGGIGIINIIKLNDSDTELYENETVSVGLLGKISTNFHKERVNMRDMIIANDLKTIEAEIADIDEIRASMANEVDEYSKLLLPEDEEAFNEFIKLREEFATQLKILEDLARANRDEEATAILSETTGAMGRVSLADEEAIHQMFVTKMEDAKVKAAANTALADKASVIMAVGVAFAVLLSIILGLFISKIISNPLKKMVMAANEIATGNLDVSLDIKSTKDEIGQLAIALNHMNQNTNDVLTDVQNATEQVDSGSRQVSDSSMSLSQGATEQASSIEELTASIEEIASQTRKNAENANQAKTIAETAKVDAVQGNEQMQKMLIAMAEINESSNNISKIIKVIDEIAFQTNILALNAAVEAARAGKHGKGFAVVAEEVRNLAARSANAAKETTDMIEGSIIKVADGTNIANKTAEALNSIVSGVSEAANLVSDIAIASNEQSIGVEQINQGIMQISEVVQTTSATSEETAAASEELSSQAEMLKTQVNKFKLKKQAKSMNYSGLDELTPEMLKMLADLSDTNKKQKAEEAKDVKKINLSDKEFGKY